MSKWFYRCLIRLCTGLCKCVKGGVGALRSVNFSTGSGAGIFASKGS